MQLEAFFFVIQRRIKLYRKANKNNLFFMFLRLNIQILRRTIRMLIFKILD